MILYLVIAFIIGLLVERERKKHRALLRSESLAAVGRTASEIAHDMKNFLEPKGDKKTSGKQRADILFHGE
jgi:hypothetical protein